MKNLSSLKSNKIDSPKTPGGISKSLLTPCRRVGLSRNWKKSGPSPFISPLSGVTEHKSDKIETRKRKELSEDVCDIESPERTEKENGENSLQNVETKSLKKCAEIDTTPSRKISLPKRKKSKTLIMSKMHKTEDSPVSSNDVNVTNIEEKVIEPSKSPYNDIVSENVTTPMQCNTQLKNRKLSSKAANEITCKLDEVENNKVNDVENNKEGATQQNISKTKSPDNLTKVCIVVLQKKMFKKGTEANVVSQALFDSDTDDVPLSVFNNKEQKIDNTGTINLDEEDDFIENTKVKVKNLKDKSTSIGLKSKPNVKKKVKEKLVISNSKVPASSSSYTECKTSSQSSFDDDEDFVIDKKRTILIRKSYDKVAKPCKAKSTGSIKQSDIDELKARIEMKKKILLAKAMGNDTEELRSLIKKWQKGCQDALIELMELMKDKCQDKNFVGYSEILETLKIPAEIVGYDEENDSFNTPSDENIILSRFNNL